ncbi:MAG: metal-dependent hydrolase [Methanoregula sp.]|nr:metal-dependent hydrolase [Methanoregula sp.]
MILYSAIVLASPLLILVICLGTGIGSILPDIQMKKPHRFQVRTFAWIVTLFGSILCTPLTCRIYPPLTGRTFHPGDKRLTHSLPGILFLWAILAMIILVPGSILMSSATLYIPTAFLGGVMLGMVLHLIEDLCTRKGITPFFPFSTLRISGSIRPCDTTDRRIAQFHYYHCSVAGIILGFQILGNWQGDSVMPICLFGLASCIGMMIFSSDVEITRDYQEDRTPAVPHLLLPDPSSVLGNPHNSTPGLLMGVYYFNKNERWNY